MHHLLKPASQPVKLLGNKADNCFTEPEFYVSKYKECNAEGALVCVTDVDCVSNYFPRAVYTFTHRCFSHSMLKLKWRFLMLGNCLMKIPHFR